jgi:tetratricopeptide (TPR) repeat protein
LTDPNLNDQAGLYEEQQQNSLAASSYAECLELLSSNSKVIPQLHYRLGTLYNTLDNSTGAIFHYRQYLELLNPDGSGDDTYLVTIRSLAQLYAKERRFEESFVMYDELIQFLEVTDEHEGELGTAYHDIGKIHLELKNLDEALENIQTSLGIRKATENSESHVAIGKALLDLAKVFCEKKEYDSATNTLLEVRKFLRNLTFFYINDSLSLHTFKGCVSI